MMAEVLRQGHSLDPSTLAAARHPIRNATAKVLREYAVAG